MGMLEDKMALRFAETMLYWRGHLRAREVQDFLGVSERTARSLIARWRRFDAMLPLYQPGAERHLIPSEEFDPSSAVTDPNIALSLLMVADHLPGNPFTWAVPHGGGHDVMTSYPIQSKAFHAVLAAYIDRQPIRLLYAVQEGYQEFVFHPAALIRSRGRYHLRGYRSEGRSATGRSLDPRYIDIVPARTIESRRTEQIPFIGLEDDTDWNTFEERRFYLSSELSGAERLCYEHEYSVADSGVLKVEQRRALMHYVLEELSERRCWRRDGTSVPIWEGL